MSDMNFTKVWVLLKQLKRGVNPDKEILDKSIEFIEGFARKEKGTKIKMKPIANKISDIYWEYG